MESGQITREDLNFGASLMSHLGDGNITISPISIRTALSMVYEGARGETARQISEAAFLPEDSLIRHEGFKAVSQSLNPIGAEQKIRYANGLWISEGYPVNQEFTNALTNNYQAEARSADFLRNPEPERLNINKWIGEKTEGKIPNLFPSGSVHQYTRFVMANALYFKSQWEDKFDKRYTQKQNFTLSNGTNIEVDMMRKGEIDSVEELPKFPYAMVNRTQLVQLRYKGQLSKILMLPPRGTSIKSLEKELIENKSNIQQLFYKMASKKFSRLEIPKHEVKGHYDLIAPLSAMGIDRIFTEGAAEFGGISSEPLWIDAGLHETYFKTDEEGSEGAAATGFAGRTFDMEGPVEFVADRPFLEAVVDNKTWAVLFLNRIEDPR